MTEDQTSEHWDAIHDMWKRENKTDIRSAEMAEAWRILGEHIPLTGRFLDVGCGTGGLIAALHERPGNELELHGTDFSAVAIGLAQQTVPSAAFTIGDSRQPLPYPDDHFDITFSGHTIEHIADPVPMLREMRRVTKPDGKIITEFPHSDPPYAEHIHHMLDYARVSEWMRDADIEIVECLPVLEMRPTNDGVIVGRRGN